MAKKQTTIQKSVAGAVPARVAKPAAPRVKSATHSKTVAADPVLIVIEEPVVVVEEETVVAAVPANPLEAISKLAYSYWEARGFEGGNALEDWVRAEEEYRAACR